MAKLNLPFVLEQLDSLIDNELTDNNADAGSEREFNLLVVLEREIASHLSDRIATSGSVTSIAEEDESWDAKLLVGVGDPFDAFPQPLVTEETVEDEAVTAS